ncbi:MAG: hypothetical protein ABIN91_04110 [Mucilaginibacter sp.]|uniref:hypothetical protein n=1 Tax=Mucilaginibacter sp. TaxID=1882438 RepID=UPI003264019C
MRTLRFYFCHPVKGRVRLSSPLCPLQSKYLPFNTDKGQVADIVIDGLESGHWKAALEWEHDGRNFFLEKEFAI